MAIPSVEDFRERFPEFAETANEAIELAIEDAGDEVDEDVWMEKDYAKGVLYLAAHFLLNYGMQAESTEDSGGGLVKSESLGRFSITYDNGASAKSSTDALDATDYGARYKRLINRNSKRLLIV